MMKQHLLNHLKNIIGWKTTRKIVVFSVDDYGNIRLDSKEARKNMDDAGLKALSHFDSFDSLESREDLEMLFEVLTSVKDMNNRSAVFTAFALPCNINFEAMKSEGFDKYLFESLPESFEKLESIFPKVYSGTWKIWEQGMSERLIIPQFHGREHFNLKVFNEKLRNKDYEVLTSLRNRSYTSISNSGYETVNYTAAFDFSEIEENYEIIEILKDGINKFKQVFGFRPTVFMPPTSKIHPMHLPLLMENGIKYIDTNLIHTQYIGDGKNSKSYNYTGKKLPTGQINLVRNVVFEPTANPEKDNVQFALDQMEAAFFWNRPVIISSHRVNFCGHIDPKNRETGLKALKVLLKKIVQKWPDIEFMGANELAVLIE